MMFDDENIYSVLDNNIQKIMHLRDYVVLENDFFRICYTKFH
jgi:hypothetical protein